MYYKQCLSSNVKLVSANEKGILWFKFKQHQMDSENDFYVCLCYIPPEDSALYRNENSPLFNFDFFDFLNSEIRKYSQFGSVFIVGDLNSRTSDQLDYVPDINLNRYVDIPLNENTALKLPVRKNRDPQSNNFGTKLLSLCKENNLAIVNGRLEQGQCTYHGVYRNRPVQSTVDYLIADVNDFNSISNMTVLDISEFSDHCPIVFTLNCAFNAAKDNYRSYDKIIWDTSGKDDFLEILNSRRSSFDAIINSLSCGEIDINQCVDDFSNIVHDISSKCFGKTFSNKSNIVKRKSTWFNNECRRSKSSFLEAKRRFLSCKTEQSKLDFLQKRNLFVKTKRRARWEFYNKEKRNLSSICKTAPRKFWKYLNKFKNRNNITNELDMQRFVTHFSDNSNNTNGHLFSSSNDDIRTDTLNIELLDTAITVQEVQKTISKLKRYKSSDIDNNVADFFIDANLFISPYLCLIFNNIFNSGVYPEAWTKGVIVPIHKKGDKSNPSNYRGITLINVMGKIFSLLLRNRLNKWCETEHILNESQFGFRDNRSTTDAIFLLHTTIQKILSKKSKLYCIFIDYQRAFDTINRDALWEKLIHSKISCKMTNMIKSIYSKVQSCIKLSNDMPLSDFFDVTIGLKQGEPLSPILFILFINDIVDSIDFNLLTEKDLNLLSMYMVLFADDIVLFTTDPVSFQSQIDCIYQYSIKWGLSINVNKTKICIFEKRKQVHNLHFYINGEEIEIVNNFTYLGVKFSYTGSLSEAVKTLHDQALVAYHNLMILFDKVTLDVKTKLRLFDTMIVPILLYGSEVWGVYNHKGIDNLHLRFCKFILGVKSQTPNDAVYGELGRLPLSVICKERSLKFWIKLMKNVDSPPYNMYVDLCNNVNSACWSSKINSIIDHLGFTYVRNFLTQMLITILYL